MKKILAIVLALLLCTTAVVALAACDLEEDGIVITFAANAGKSLQEVINDAIKDFEAIYPGITIKPDYTASNYDALFDANTKALSTNKGPSVTYCYPDHVASYKKDGKALELNSFVNSTEIIPAGSVYGNTEDILVGYTAEQKADFITAFWEEGYKSYVGPNATEADGIYSIAFAKSSEAMFYKKDFFEGNDIQIPTHWWCTETTNGKGGCTGVQGCPTSMETVCAQIKAIDSNCYPLGYDSDANFFITLCEQFGAPYTSATGNHYLFNNDTIKDVIAHFAQWFKNGWLRTYETLGKKYTSNLFTLIDTADKNELNIYMSIGSTGGTSYQEPTGDAYVAGVTGIPQADPANGKVIMQGPSIAVLNHKQNRTEEQQMASWLWVKFLTTNIRVQSRFSMTNGYAPVLKSVHTDPTYVASFLEAEYETESEGLKAAAVKQTLDQASWYYTSPAFNGSSEARTQVTTLLAGCIALDPASASFAIDLNDKFAQAVAICEQKAPSKK